jgi:hypothetical protein
MGSSIRDFLQRPYHAFLSYSSKDVGFANALRLWLDNAGLRVWFDQLEMRSGSRVEAELPESISKSQALISVISKSSLSSAYVQDELYQALAEKKKNARFQIVLLRLDDCDVAEDWKAVRVYKWHDLATPDGPRLSMGIATDILCLLHAYDTSAQSAGDLKEVYVSRGWREGEDFIADALCRSLARTGLRLVGDLPDQKSTDNQRITDIMRSCWGHALILPQRVSARGAGEAYKHFVREQELSGQLGLPQVIFAQEGAELPPSLAPEAFIVAPRMFSEQADPIDPVLRSRICDFRENLCKPAVEVHAFFASEWKGSEDRNSLARRIIEATGTLPCYWGKDYKGSAVNAAIRDGIVSSKFVVADLTKAPTEASESSHVNTNACIEAGIAWGAGLEPLALAAANPRAAANPPEERTRHIPFMFRNAQLELYEDDDRYLAPGVRFLGAVHKLVEAHRKQFGRRVINNELGV